MNRVNKKYINITRKDGIGFQLNTFAKLVNSTDIYDFIVDIRDWSFFARTDEVNFTRILNLFNFHERAIVDPIEIDKIKRKYIIDLSETEEKYIDYELTLGHKANFENSYTTDNLLMSLKEEPNLDFDIEQCVGVHGRFGNGEELDKHKIKLIERIRPKNLYIEKMKKYNNKPFFVCSDSKSFIDLCYLEFGDKIKTQDRTFLPEGCGPGHVPFLYLRKDIEIDPITLLYESYVDFHLLTKCSYLICGASQFNLFARSSICDNNIEFLI